MNSQNIRGVGQRLLTNSGSNPKVGEALMPRCRRGPWSYISASLLTIFTLALLLVFPGTPAFPPESVFAAPTGQSAGSLGIIGKDGSIKGDCPLKHTDVRGAISGFLARITVTQIFENAASNPIEAVYTFPLPQDAAVDDMTIQVGGRTIRSAIKKREEARAIYERAKATGHTAALLDQERPNIFSQAVANIMPGEEVTVTISYAETLQFQDGGYELVFPMVVGPRYIPGQSTGKQAGGWAPDTDKVPDASRITPNVAVPGTRAGHDISVELAIDAAVPIQDLHSSSHQIEVEHTALGFAKVKLQNEGEIPNKDFVLKYQVAGDQVSDAVLSHWVPEGAADGGYFTLILQPPARVPESDITPKELVFVLDNSGSMSGFPIEKGKQLIGSALDELYPGDTFNVITFSGDTQILFAEPVFPTADNIRVAKNFLNGSRGGGGTEMMAAIRAALVPSDSQDHMRIVCFVTDGYVGNDMQIIGEVQKHPNARVFAFGIGTSVNRFLIEGMARAGRGESEVVTLNDKADEAAHRLYQRLRSPLLTDLSVDWRGLPVTDIYPQRLPDLFDGKPLVVSGRYTTPTKGSVQLRGKRAGEDFVRDIPVSFTSSNSQNSVLAGFWARRKIDDLMSHDWAGAQSGSMKLDLQKEITQLGLDYRLMTQFTSFVAVEDRVVTKDGKPQRVEVPVEMPEGVNYEGVFGNESKQFDRLSQYARLSRASPVIAMSPPAKGVSSGGGMGRGVASNSFGVPSVAVPPGPPPPPPVGMTSSEDRSEVQTRLTPERLALESKLHQSLIEAFDCAAKGETRCKLVHEGKVEVQVWLAQKSDSVLELLRKAGFEPSVTQDKTLVGTVPVTSLPALTQIIDVKFISPVRR